MTSAPVIQYVGMGAVSSLTLTSIAPLRTPASLKSCSWMLVLSQLSTLSHVDLLMLPRPHMGSTLTVDPEV